MGFLVYPEKWMSASTKSYLRIRQFQDYSPFHSVTSTSRYRTKIFWQTNRGEVDCWGQCGKFLPPQTRWWLCNVDRKATVLLKQQGVTGWRSGCEGKGQGTEKICGQWLHPLNQAWRATGGDTSTKHQLFRYQARPWLKSKETSLLSSSAQNTLVLALLYRGE